MRLPYCLEAYSKRNNIALSDTQFTMLMCGMEHSLKLLLAKDHNLSGTKGGSRPSWSLSWTLSKRDTTEDLDLELDVMYTH